MQDQLALGVVLFGLLVVPFLAYGVLSWFARQDFKRSESREDTTPSTTGAQPSRNIPGGGRRDS
ncbi:hypothetical protein [Salinarchaeum laminariae]|uniref:hypothetical protein n=1 Tax=Salinarchaeum laminariae TaxID=869888 RepID=UPI0020C03AC0|nr:hypothetical protein [Salinarchaeum laminariae]